LFLTDRRKATLNTMSDKEALLRPEQQISDESTFGFAAPSEGQLEVMLAKLDSNKVPNATKKCR